MRGLLVLGLLGCGRHSFESQELVELGDADALALCSHMASPHPEGTLVAWLEHPWAEPRISMRASIVRDGRERKLAELAPDLPRNVGLSIAIGRRPLGHVVMVGGADLLLAVTLDDTGTIVNSVEDTSGTDYDGLAVAPSGTGFRGFFHDNARIQRVELDELGQRMAVAQIVTTTFTQEWPSIAATPMGHLVAWQEYETTRWQARIAVVAPDGTAAPSLAIDPRAVNQFSPRVFDNGAGAYTVVWLEDTGVYARDLGADGVPVGPSQLIVTAPNRAESFTYDAGGAAGTSGIVWESDRDTILPQIVLHPVVPDGALTVLTDNRSQFLCPRIAATEGELTVTMRGRIDGRARVFLRAVQQ